MPHTFAELLVNSTHGEIDEIASKEMASLVADMMNAQRLMGGKQKGTLNLKLSFVLEANGVMDTTAEVTSKRPPRTKPRAFLFIQRDGSLSEEDTRQGSLFGGEQQDKSTARDVSTPGDKKVRDITDHRAAASGERI